MESAGVPMLARLAAPLILVSLLLACSPDAPRDQADDPVHPCDGSEACVRAGPTSSRDVVFDGSELERCPAGWEQIGRACKQTCASTGLTCGPHSACADGEQEPSCVCDAGWERVADGCEWSGGFRDPEFTDAAAWRTGGDAALTSDAGADDSADSDPLGSYAQALSASYSDLDFGFYQATTVGDRVWLDSNGKERGQIEQAIRNKPGN